MRFRFGVSTVVDLTGLGFARFRVALGTYKVLGRVLRFRVQKVGFLEPNIKPETQNPKP